MYYQCQSTQHLLSGIKCLNGTIPSRKCSIMLYVHTCVWRRRRWLVSSKAILVSSYRKIFRRSQSNGWSFRTFCSMIFLLKFFPSFLDTPIRSGWRQTFSRIWSLWWFVSSQTIFMACNYGLQIYRILISREKREILGHFSREARKKLRDFTCNW